MNMITAILFSSMSETQKVFKHMSLISLLCVDLHAVARWVGGLSNSSRSGKCLLVDRANKARGIVKK